MENDRETISESFARQEVFHAMKRKGRGKDQVISNLKLQIEDFSNSILNLKSEI
jgi:hypothetical protein